MVINRPEWFNENLKLTLHMGNSWRYLTSVQSNILDKIIKVLKNAKTQDKKLCTSDIVKAVGFSWDTINRVLMMLVSARILRDEQYGRVVLYSFCVGWENRLKQNTQRRGIKDVS